MTYRGGPRTVLHESEITTLVERAAKVRACYPSLRKKGDSERWWQLRALADDYGISLRTLYRYLRRVNR